MSEDLRNAIANAISGEIMFSDPKKDPPLYDRLGDLIAAAPQATIRVTIAVDVVDGKVEPSLPCDRKLVEEHAEYKLSVLLVRVRLNGKDASEALGHGAAPDAYDYILVSQSEDTPPREDQPMAVQVTPTHEGP